MPFRLNRIDGLHRNELRYLEPGDECFYLGEYAIRKGYRFSPMNGLIFNLKKDLSHRGSPAWQYKIQAIDTAAAWLRESLPRHWLFQTTLVPIPPSKAKSDPEHDDRLVRVLDRLKASGVPCDVRELIVQEENYEASHGASNRVGPDQLKVRYRLDSQQAVPRPESIALFDDVITSGAHFRAAKDLLVEAWPGMRVLGVFLARAIRVETFD